MSLDSPSAVATLPPEITDSHMAPGNLDGVRSIMLRNDGTTTGPDYLLMMDQGPKEGQNDRVALFEVGETRRAILAVDGIGKKSGGAAEVVVAVVAEHMSFAPTSQEELSPWLDSLSRAITNKMRRQSVKGGSTWSLALNMEGGVFLAHAGDARWVIPQGLGAEPMISEDENMAVSNFMQFHGRSGPSSLQRTTLSGLLRGASAIDAESINVLKDTHLSETQLAELAAFALNSNVLMDCSSAQQIANPRRQFYQSADAVWLVVMSDGVSGITSMQALADTIVDAEEGTVPRAIEGYLGAIIDKVDDPGDHYRVPFTYGRVTLHVRPSGDNRGLVVARMTPLPKSEY